MNLRQPRAVLLALLVGLSTFVLLVAAISGWMQVRKAYATQAHKLEWKDSVSHTAVGFERQFLQFRGRLATYVASGSPQAAQDAAARYEVLVNRIDLLSTTVGMDKLMDSAEHQSLLPALEALVREGDALFAQPSLPQARARELLDRMDRLVPDVARYTGAAARVTYGLVDEQFQALQQQAVFIGALAVLQLLLVVVVGLALRAWQREQLRARQRLEQLAGELGEAKQAAEAAALAKSQFLANMSHELRTPFQGVLGMLQLLGKTPLRGEQQELVQTAHGSATHLLAILNEILDLSALEAGKAVLHAEAVELHQLCRDIEAPMRVQANERGLSLIFTIDAPEPSWVMGDPTRLKQIMFNLLSNAIKFTPRGEVRLDLRVTHPNPAEAQISLCVTDTGIGMDADTQARLFQRFSPGDGRLNRRFSGAGLGLEISRNLARLMGGDLEAHSELGRGSRFVMTLRLPCAEPPRAPAPAASALVQRPLRVLVADDHPINRRYMGLVLEALRHEATFCANGQEALATVQAQSFDAILMDIHMPVMDGLEATRAIRALGGAAARVPILALSADVLPGSRERAVAAGCTDFLCKPLQVEGLVAALASIDPAAEPPAPLQTADAPLPQNRRADTSTLAPRFQEMALCLPPAQLGELLAMFFADDSNVLSGLRNALLAADREQVCSGAHKCKGSARMLGLQAIADVADAAECWARGAADEDCTPQGLVENFDQAIQDSRRELTRMLPPTLADVRATEPA